MASETTFVRGEESMNQPGGGESAHGEMVETLRHELQDLRLMNV